MFILKVQQDDFQHHKWMRKKNMEGCKHFKILEFYRSGFHIMGSVPF